MTATATIPPADGAERASEAGFTLVELMVVVAIIALLAAVVIPNFVHARAQAAVSASEANMKQIATALELYYADHQSYPTTSGNVTPTLFGGGTNPYLTSTPVNALKRDQYLFTDQPQTGGTPESYTLRDPGVYDPTTLGGLSQAPGSTGQCASCTKIVYTPQAGFYGTP